MTPAFEGGHLLVLASVLPRRPYDVRLSASWRNGRLLSDNNNAERQLRTVARGHCLTNRLLLDGSYRVIWTPVASIETLAAADGPAPSACLCSTSAGFGSLTTTRPSGTTGWPAESLGTKKA